MRFLSLIAALALAGCAGRPAPAPVEKTSADRVNLRQLRATLPGGNAAEVRRKLGPPEWVTTLGEREVWEWRGLTDTASQKSVALLEVEFINRRVTAVNFVY